MSSYSVFNKFSKSHQPYRKPYSYNTGFVDVVNPKMFKKRTIVSYSIILHTLIDGEIHYLLAHVRDSIPFREFVKGNIPDYDIPKYISSMSLSEKYRLISEPFMDLLNDILLNRNTRIYKNAKTKSDDFYNNATKYYELLTDDNVGFKELPFIFPKGRKQEPESEKDCALREFEEETHIPKHKIVIYNEFEPLEELYTGLDGKFYKTVYYLGFLNFKDFSDYLPLLEMKYIKTNKRVSLSEELSKIFWLTYEQSIEKINESKKYILRHVNSFLIFNLDKTMVTRRKSF